MRTASLLVASIDKCRTFRTPDHGHSMSVDTVSTLSWENQIPSIAVCRAPRFNIRARDMFLRPLYCFMNCLMSLYGITQTWGMESAFLICPSKLTSARKWRLPSRARTLFAGQSYSPETPFTSMVNRVTRLPD
jgi:hypothetical protein